MKRRTLSIIIALHCVGTLRLSAGAVDITLDEAVNRCLAGNREVRAQARSVESAKSSLASSYGKFLPQLNVEWKYTRINDPLVIDLNDIRSVMINADLATLQAAGVTNPASLAAFRGGLEAGIPSFDLAVQKDGYTNCSATLTQPLFTGGKLLANTAARREDVRIAEARDAQARNKAVVECVTNYCRVRMMEDVVSVRKDIVDGLAAHENQAVKLFEQGMISAANKMRADVALAEAKREYAKAQRDLELSRVLLATSLGESSFNGSAATPLFLSPKVETVDIYLKLAQGRNPALLVLEHQKQQLAAKGRAVRSNFMPTVAAFGKYEIDRTYLTVLEPEWAAGVSARINIFSGGSDAYDAQSVRRDREALDLLADNAAELVATDVRKRWMELQSSREQFESLEVSRGLAEENLRLNRLSFAEGMATSIEVIDAELSLGKVKLEQAKALFDYDTGLAGLLAACGSAADICSYR